MKFKTSTAALISCAAIFSCTSVYAATTDADDQETNKSISPMISHSNMGLTLRQPAKQVAFLKDLALTQAQLAKITALNEFISQVDEKLFVKQEIKADRFDPILGDQLALGLSIIKSTALQANVMMIDSHRYSTIFHEYLTEEQQEKVMAEIKVEAAQEGVNEPQVIGYLLNAPELIEQATKKPDPVAVSHANKKIIERIKGNNSPDVSKAFIKDLALTESQAADIEELRQATVDDVVKPLATGLKLQYQSMLDPNINRITVDQIIVNNQGLWANVYFNKINTAHTILHDILDQEQQEKVMEKIKEKALKDSRFSGGNLMGVIYNEAIRIHREAE